MKNINKVTTIIVLSILTITACAQQPKTNYYLSISHEVADYDNWRAVFDNFSTDRKESGINDLFVKQNINNTNSITVFSKVTNLEKAKEFMSSPTLKEAMAKAGVISQPEIVFYNSADEYEAISPSSLITTISHSVTDVSAWKKTYYASGDLRNNAGIVDHYLLISLSDENVVTVLGSSSSAEGFLNFISNPDLKKTMEKAGVSSKPEVRILL